MSDHLTLVNFFLSRFWVIVILGVLHVSWQERRLMTHRWLNSSPAKGDNESISWQPLWRRLWYVIAGAALVLLAWAIVITILKTFIAPVNVRLDGDGYPSNHGLVTAARSWMGFLAYFGVLGFLAAGTSLTLSAGSRWLVGLSKLLVTVTILTMFTMVYLAALP